MEEPKFNLNAFTAAVAIDPEIEDEIHSPGEGIDNAEEATPIEEDSVPTEEEVVEAPVNTEPKKEESKPDYDFNSIVFEEPVKPELPSLKYLKEWGFESIEALREQSPGVAELVELLDKTINDKYDLELDTYKLKSSPEVKEALVTNQVVSFINENTNAWASEFISDVLSPEDIKTFNNLNKTKSAEIKKYIDETIPEYVFKRKLAGKEVHNPFIFYKTEIINKIREVASTPTQPKGNPQPIQKQNTQTIDQRKAAASIGNAGSIPKAPTNSVKPISGVYSKFKALGI